LSRGLSSAVKTQLASGSFVMAHLVKLEFDTTYYYTDFSSGISDSGNTYSANGFLTTLGAVSESSRMNIGSMNLALSAVNQTIVSDVLNNGHLNRVVTIKRAILDNSNVVVGSFSIYSGFIEGMSIRDSGGSSSISFSVANHWADFERREGRSTNNSSQQHYFSEDVCFEFADQTGKRLYWGNINILNDDPGWITDEDVENDANDNFRPPDDIYDPPPPPPPPPPPIQDNYRPPETSQGTGTDDVVAPNFWG
jgi:hypothetical protein